jgi:hypothetical protein
MKKRCAKQSDVALAVRLASIILAAASICFAQEGRKVLRNPAPVYPALAKRMNLSGVQGACGTHSQAIRRSVPGFRPGAVACTTYLRERRRETTDENRRRDLPSRGPNRKGKL